MSTTHPAPSTVTVAAPTNPVDLTGRYAPRLSRWLWLVKMFLAVPHFLTLIPLTIAMLASTLFAGVAILFTGHYPKWAFSFNVGVLRWHWRVGFYVYAALGTDAYPPFSLKSRQYPADLVISYPARLSRGLVLVKWLLAVPQLILVALFVVDILSYPWGGAIGGYSVLNLLVVIAGVMLLFAGEYPKPYFEFLMSINRWIYTVIAYIAFMRDEYPSFRIAANAQPKVIRR